MLEIEGYFIDRQGKPIDQCTVDIVAWEGEVLASTVDWSNHFVVRVAEVEYSTPVFFRIKARNPLASSTQHEIDSPGVVLQPGDKKLRLFLVATRASGQALSVPEQPARPAWVLLPMPEDKTVKRVG